MKSGEKLEKVGKSWNKWGKLGKYQIGSRRLVRFLYCIHILCGGQIWGHISPAKNCYRAKEAMCTHVINNNNSKDTHISDFDNANIRMNISILSTNRLITNPGSTPYFWGVMGMCGSLLGCVLHNLFMVRGIFCT